MNPTQTIIEIDSIPLEIKARQEDGRWAVIMFTQSLSMRSNKVHLHGVRDAFIRAAVYAIIDPQLTDEEDQIIIDKAIRAVDEAIRYVTTNFSN